MDTVTSLVEKVQTFSINEEGKTINRYFEEVQSAMGVVILNEQQHPVGLIMRTHFYQMIGTQFGFNIYMNRPVRLLMKQEILCMDSDCDLASFGYKAMGRGSDDVYDFVIVLKDGIYYGVVSISNFLAAMSDMKQREIELLNEQQKILEEAHEKEKAFRREIEQKNKSIKNLMNNADQGFLSFSEDLIIYEEHSSVCSDIYGKEIAGENFVTLMKNYLDHKSLNLLSETLGSLFQQKKKSRARVFLKLLPTEFTLEERYIKITYKIISFKQDKVLMVILTDITAKKALERQRTEEKNNMKLVLSSINNKSEILEAISEARQFFDSDVTAIIEGDSTTSEKLALCFRVIHTMKGDFALRSLHNTAYELHHIEDRLSEMMLIPTGIDRDMLQQFIKSIELDSLISRDLDIIQDFLGPGYLDSERNITISNERLDILLRMVQDRFRGDDLSYLEYNISKLTYPTLRSVLNGYNEYIQLLALKLNKSIDDFHITGDEVYLKPQAYSHFLKSVIHIFRNIVDHGIELPEERIELDKTEKGQIRCHVGKAEEDGYFVLTISDDGKGIDPKIIKKKALQKQILSEQALKDMSDEEILNIIFMDAFSTKDSVSMLSGRGVGLAAVKTEVEALGGQISVNSTLGQGSTFTIRLAFDLSETAIEKASEQALI